MPRKPRIYLAGVPSHIVARGNDRQACFFSDADYHYYLGCLRDACGRYDVAVHAYVLMTNHVHLLMTPASVDGISRVMQLLGNRYVQHINKTHRRSGTLWEGRHHSSLVNAERYLLACYRYIERNPSRAGLVTDPGDYRWSSYRYHADGAHDPVVTDHAIFLRIAPDAVMRRRHYRALCRTDPGPRDLADIRRAATFSKPLGNDPFKRQVASRRHRSTSQRGPPRDAGPGQ